MIVLQIGGMRFVLDRLVIAGNDSFVGIGKRGTPRLRLERIALGWRLTVDSAKGPKHPPSVYEFDEDDGVLVEGGPSR